MMQSLSAEFSRLFGADQSADGWAHPLPRREALEGELGKSPLRTVCWRLFFGMLPRSNPAGTWLEATKQTRREYAVLMATHKTDPTKDDEDDDPLMNNPLSLDQGSAWSK